MGRNKSCLLILFLGWWMSWPLSAQEATPVKIAHGITSWRVLDRFASVDSIPMDTLHLNFQNDNHIDRFSIANSFRGNLGSPLQSKLFFDRPQKHDFIFADAYQPYMKLIESATFYNTKTPFTSLYHLSGGSNYYKDEQIRFLFTSNSGKKLNFGTTLDYIYARGEYANLAAKRFAGSVFLTYDGKNYKATAHASTNNHSNYESGGIQDTTYINGPISYPSQNIPVNIRGYSNFKYNQLFFNQQYNIGIDRPIRVNEDSVRMEYVPVTILGHTLQVDDLRKRYFEPSAEKSFYENTYLPEDITNDTAAMVRVTNRFSFSIAEEFNKWLQFGLTAYVENDIDRFIYLYDNVLFNDTQSNTRVGGMLSKQRGRLLRYHVQGDITLLGPKLGDFNLDGEMTGAFQLGRQQIELKANGYVKSEAPSFFLNYYESNHFRWNRQFGNVYRTNLGGKFSIPTLLFQFNLSVENLTNLVYFDTKALPQQYDGNIQVLAANLRQDLRLGKIHLENNVVYQLSSHQDIVPLPDVTLYHNLYYLDKWFDVLSMQIGIDMRYHTAYYAPSYMPATGQFHVQHDQLIGNYPVMNVYLNAHLKRTRFFVQYYHINQLFMRGNYYSMPYYPINPATLKIGLTWNFYD